MFPGSVSLAWGRAPGRLLGHWAGHRQQSLSSPMSPSHSSQPPPWGPTSGGDAPVAPDGSAASSSTKSLMLESPSATHSAPGYCWAGGAVVGQEHWHFGNPPAPPRTPGQPTCGCSCSCAGAGPHRPPHTPSSAGSAGQGSWPRPPGSSSGTPSGHPVGSATVTLRAQHPWDTAGRGHRDSPAGRTPSPAGTG